jgi:hypothetical protein
MIAKCAIRVTDPKFAMSQPVYGRLRLPLDNPRLEHTISTTSEILRQQPLKTSPVENMPYMKERCKEDGGKKR